MRRRFRRRAAIELLLSHHKQDFRLWRCFLKGFQGDQLNLMLAAAAWNFRKWMRLFVPFLASLSLLALDHKPLLSPTENHLRFFRDD